MNRFVKVNFLIDSAVSLVESDENPYIEIWKSGNNTLLKHIQSKKVTDNLKNSFLDLVGHFFPGNYC